MGGGKGSRRGKRDAGKIGKSGKGRRMGGKRVLRTVHYAERGCVDGILPDKKDVGQRRPGLEAPVATVGAGRGKLWGDLRRGLGSGGCIVRRVLSAQGIRKPWGRHEA